MPTSIINNAAVAELAAPALPTAVAGVRTRRRKSAASPLRVVAIGGGTGLPVLLRGLSRAGNLGITAIVAVSDDGGSSGRLRKSMGVPAVGDLRNCLAALSAGGSSLADLLQHRFSLGSLDGHALGNLFLAALHERTGSLARSCAIAARMMRIKGRALPVTDTPVTLCASFADGSVIRGESQIPGARQRIEKLWLEPGTPVAAPGVLDAIHAADIVVLAPGSLYTSLLPNLLVAGVTDAIRQSAAAKILVCNLMTQPGETDGFLASDHLRVIQAWLGGGVVDYCIANSARVPAAQLRYLESGSQLVVCDAEQVGSMGPIPIVGDLVTLDRGRVRHNPERLAQLVMSSVRDLVSSMPHLERQNTSREGQNHVSIDTRQIHQVGKQHSDVPLHRVRCAGADNY
jgi:uncharacterized cofD-like protein